MLADTLSLAQLGFSAVFAAAMAVVVYRLLTGGIRTAGLLRDKATGQVSPARIQLLVLTLVGAGTYLGLVLEGLQHAASEAALGRELSLPSPPQELFWLLGGSQAIYLGAKSAAQLPFLNVLKGLFHGGRA